MIYKGLHTYYYYNTLEFQPVTQVLSKGRLAKSICQNISSLYFDKACAELAEALSMTAFIKHLLLFPGHQ